MAARWPHTTWLLVESAARRCAVLDEAVRRLELADRVAVRQARAEEAGRDPSLRGAYDLVVARSFGAPAVTAECAAPFLRVGGRLLVSEPPAPAAHRWPVEGLAALGMAPERPVAAGRAHAQILVQQERCPERFPRRTGIPTKRPLF